MLRQIQLYYRIVWNNLIRLSVSLDQLAGMNMNRCGLFPSIVVAVEAFESYTNDGVPLLEK